MKNYLTQKQVKAIAKTYKCVMDLQEFCTNLYCKQEQQGVKEPLTYSWGYDTKSGKTQIEQLQTSVCNHEWTFTKKTKTFNTLQNAIQFLVNMYENDKTFDYGKNKITTSVEFLHF